MPKFLSIKFFPSVYRKLLLSAFWVVSDYLYHSTAEFFNLIAQNVLIIIIFLITASLTVLLPVNEMTGLY